jgi:hypothetical protein
MYLLGLASVPVAEQTTTAMFCCATTRRMLNLAWTRSAQWVFPMLAESREMFRYHHVNGDDVVCNAYMRFAVTLVAERRVHGNLVAVLRRGSTWPHLRFRSALPRLLSPYVDHSVKLRSPGALLVRITDKSNLTQSNLTSIPTLNGLRRPLKTTDKRVVAIIP